VKLQMVAMPFDRGQQKYTAMSQIPCQETPISVTSRIFGNPYLLLSLTMLFWAGNTIAGRGIRDDVPPLALAWLRWTIAALITLPFAWPHLKRDRAVIIAHWPMLTLLGSIGAGTFVSMYYVGLATTPAINAMVINSAAPILIPFASYFFYRERPSSMQAAGVAVSLLGVLIVLAKGNLLLLLSLDLNQGDLWVLTAVATWAVYTALLRKQPTMHWLSFAAVTFIVASLVNFPLFVGEAFFRSINPTPMAIFAIAYVSTLPSVVAQIFFIRSVELIGANRAGAFMHFIPLFGAVLAIALLGEELHFFHIVGFAMILAGVTFASRPTMSNVRRAADS
jgi:drug/metabolite transporter (DMT)-like permease